MTYRDDDAVLRERIERLELSLAKSAGRTMLLTEERDALLAELGHLTRNPKALARVRGKNQGRSALFIALRILGVLGIGAVVVPMLIGAAAVIAGGELLTGLLCAALPMLLLAGVFLLKAPNLVTALELRVERKQRERRARELSAPQVRVATGVYEQAAYDEAAYDKANLEARSASARRRR